MTNEYDDHTGGCFVQALYRTLWKRRLILCWWTWSLRI